MCRNTPCRNGSGGEEKKSTMKGREVEKGKLRQGNKFCCIYAVLAANHAEKRMTRERGQQGGQRVGNRTVSCLNLSIFHIVKQFVAAWDAKEEGREAKVASELVMRFVENWLTIWHVLAIQQEAVEGGEKRSLSLHNIYKNIILLNLNNIKRKKKK